MELFDKDEMDSDELRQLADLCRTKKDGDFETVAKWLDQAADRMESLEGRNKELSQVCAIAEDMLVGSRKEETYNRRLEEAGIIGDDSDD